MVLVVIWIGGKVPFAEGMTAAALFNTSGLIIKPPVAIFTKCENNF